MMKTKDSLATAIHLIFYYVIIVFVGTILLSGAYTVHALCKTLVAGQPLKSFNITFFTHGLFFAFPLMLVSIGALMIFYLIRHSSTSWLPLIVYGILYLCLSWGILLPISFKMQQKYDTFNINTSAVPLSSGYFRNFNGKVFYYSAVTKENVADGVCFDLASTAKNVYTFTGEKLGSEYDFSDSLIENSMQTSALTNIVMQHCALFCAKAYSAHKNGSLAWLNFSLLGFALLSLAGMRHISKWRLVNVMVITYASALILEINILYDKIGFLVPIANKINELFARFTFFTNPFLAVFNILIFLIFAITGLLIDIKRKRQPKATVFSDFDDDFEGDFSE